MLPTSGPGDTVNKPLLRTALYAMLVSPASIKAVAPAHRARSGWYAASARPKVLFYTPT